MTAPAGDSSHDEANSQENKDIAKQQPGGGVNPRVLLAIAAVLVVAGIITLIVFLTRS